MTAGLDVLVNQLFKLLFTELHALSGVKWETVPFFHIFLCASLKMSREHYFTAKGLKVENARMSSEIIGRSSDVFGYVQVALNSG